MELVPPPPPDDDEFVYELTERQRRTIVVTATVLAATAYGDTEALGARVIESEDHGSLLAALPPCTWGQGASWRRQMARAFDDLAADVAAGTDPKPTCTGEEMALHIILTRASSDHLAGHLDQVLAKVPAHDNDTDWAAPTSFLFQDHDVLSLYEEDGVPIRDGVNLEPEKWFLPFDDATARNPARSFRF